MKEISNDLILKIQSYVDEELASSERLDIELFLQKNSEARQMEQSLRRIKESLIEGEPSFTMPLSREHNWNVIRSRIQTENRKLDQNRSSSTWISWLRWGMPGMALAVFAIALVLKGLQSPKPELGPVLGVNHELVTESDEAVAFTFRSENAGMTVVWVEGRHDF